jgi:hypothetical protein
MDGTVCHVNKDGVEAIVKWNSNEHIMAFVDGDKKGYQPTDYLMNGENGTVQIILASSPKGALAGGMWTKQESSVMKLATALS